MHCVTQFNCQKRDGRGSDKFTKLNSGTSLTLPEYVDLRLAIIAAQLPPTYLRIKESSGHNSTVAIAGYPELFQVKPSVFCGTRSIITKKERVYLGEAAQRFDSLLTACLLYTSDAADERSSVDLGGRRIIKKKPHESNLLHHMLQNNNTNTSSLTLTLKCIFMITN